MSFFDRRPKLSSPPAVAVVLLLSALIPAGAQQAAASQGAGEPGGENAAEKYFTNVELVNQHGEPMRLYRDLLEGKVVVIDTIFTECTGICPVMSKTLQKMQEHVGDRMGEEVHFLSISVDPENDTPERLAEYAERFGARKGWYFLTGEKENLDLALKRLGGYVENREAHSAVLIFGNEPTGLWKKALGLAPAQKILPIFDTVLNDSGSGAGGDAPAPGR